LHPFWSSGFHLSRWGFNNSRTMNEVKNKFDNLKIPIDTIWNDIDYMDRYADFTIDT